MQFAEGINWNEKMGKGVRVMGCRKGKVKENEIFENSSKSCGRADKMKEVKKKNKKNKELQPP